MAMMAQLVHPLLRRISLLTGLLGTVAVLLIAQLVLTTLGVRQVNAALLGEASRWSAAGFRLSTVLALLQLILVIASLARAAVSPRRVSRARYFAAIVIVALVVLNVTALAMRAYAYSPEQLPDMLHPGRRLQVIEGLEALVTLTAIGLSLDHGMPEKVA
jgi:hypothetical protein